MRLRILKAGLWAVFLISLASLGAIVIFINPYSAGRSQLAFFNLAVFFVLLSILSIIGIYLRRKFIFPTNDSRILKMVLRQSALLSIAIVSFVWLSRFRLFKIWTAVPVLVLVVGLEYFLLMRIRDPKNPLLRQGYGGQANTSAARGEPRQRRE